jgi:hypothetical protein
MSCSGIDAGRETGSGGSGPVGAVGFRVGEREGGDPSEAGAVGAPTVGVSGVAVGPGCAVGGGDRFLQAIEEQFTSDWVEVLQIQYSANVATQVPQASAHVGAASLHIAS